MTTFKSLLMFVLMFAAVNDVAFLSAEEPGYTDTPFLPNSKWRVHDQTRPQPRIIVPGKGDIGATAPSDAVVLYDGKNLDAWLQDDGKPAGDGILADGSFDIHKTGQLHTKQKFGDCQLHVEWLSPPEEANVDRMNRGNSGVLMMGVFEIQIIESNDSYIYADGNAGAVYGQHPPLVNPARKPGEWQSFNIFFTVPKFDGEKMLAPAYVTVVYNGVIVQNHAEILGTVSHRALPGKYPAQSQGPILLQEHHSAVKFRNIWVRSIAPSID
ncbi:MAG: DUF1080 domain-containing protein [Planctomycetaceae bacterium]|nr:DUF1080 domain-containing protein [Planctomycetaceae bacterium]